MLARLRPLQPLTAVMALTAATVVGWLIVVPSAARAATFSGTDGVIAYSQFSSGGSQIKTVDPASAVVRDLSKKVYGDDQPQFSPTGTLLVFRHGHDIWTMNAKGARRTNLTAGSAGSNADPAWSPDGSRIVFQSNGDIETMNANGTGISILTTDGADSAPDWSPDGTLIAFDSYQDAGRLPHVLVMRPDGTHVTDLSHVTDTGDQSYDQNPSWSADSTHLVVQSDRTPTSGGAPIQVWSLSRTGGTVSQLTAFGSNTYGPVTSPDDQDIAYTRNPGDGTSQICLSSGGCLTQGPDTAIGSDASWQARVHTTITASPTAGKPGTIVHLTLAGYADGDSITIRLLDGQTTTILATVTADGTGHATATATIPGGASPATATITGTAVPSGRSASTTFTVRPSVDYG